MRDRPKPHGVGPNTPWSHEKEVSRWTEKLANPTLRRGHELFLSAWQQASGWEYGLEFPGDGRSPVALMEEAARLDTEYERQIAELHDYLDRRDRVRAVERMAALIELRRDERLTEAEFEASREELLREVDARAADGGEA